MIKALAVAGLMNSTALRSVSLYRCSSSTRIVLNRLVIIMLILDSTFCRETSIPCWEVRSRKSSIPRISGGRQMEIQMGLYIWLHTQIPLEILCSKHYFRQAEIFLILKPSLGLYIVISALTDLLSLYMNRFSKYLSSWAFTGGDSLLSAHLHHLNWILCVYLGHSSCCQHIARKCWR